MKTEEWFGVALRLVGLVALLYGARDLLDALLFRLNYFSQLETSPRYYVVMGLAQIFVGLYLLRGAPALARFAFPGAREDEDDETDEGDVPPGDDGRASPDAR